MSPSQNNTTSALLSDALTDAYSGRTVLITGGRGYIGSAIAGALAAVDCKLILLDNSPADAWVPKDPKAEIQLRRGDIVTAKTWEENLPGVDHVFHLAAREYYYRSGYEPERDLESNALPVLHLLESCRKQSQPPRIVFASSANLYGCVDTLPVDEEHRDDPLSLWAIHKLTAERYLKLYAEMFGIPSVTLRLTNVFGPTARQDVTTRVVVNNVIAKALSGDTLVTFGNRDCVRDYVYLDDVVQAFLLAGSGGDPAGSPVYVLGSGEGRTIGDVWRMIAESVKAQTGREVPIKCDDTVKIEPLERRSFIADTTRFQKAVGWEPKTSLANGIDMTVRELLLNSGGEA